MNIQDLTPQEAFERGIDTGRRLEKDEIPERIRSNKLNLGAVDLAETIALNSGLVQNVLFWCMANQTKVDLQAVFKSAEHDHIVCSDQDELEFYFGKDWLTPVRALIPKRNREAKEIAA